MGGRFGNERKRSSRLPTPGSELSYTNTARKPSGCSVRWHPHSRGNFADSNQEERTSYGQGGLLLRTAKEIRLRSRPSSKAVWRGTALDFESDCRRRRIQC